MENDQVNVSDATTLDIYMKSEKLVTPKSAVSPVATTCLVVLFYIKLLTVSSSSH